MTVRAQKPGSTPRGPARPFSRPIDVRRLADSASEQRIVADDAERAALAAAIGVPGIGSLTGRFELRRRAGGRVTVVGDVAASVTQICVVTLEPFDTAVKQEVDLVFAPATPEEAVRHRRGEAGRDEFEIDASPRSVPGSDDQVDPPDPIVDDVIDLGLIAVEFVALALDPYPRKPGASFDDVIDPRDADEPSAFAALGRLKDPERQKGKP